uniref:Uncharacterized protein n=1 Tax=Toxoplasma gondii (strain ATCC 50861 / VEG) TaxID=432359 RepID=A0A0F7V804_TOXGV|nr:TPA: hypothetical protein BN1205_000770 [Toxoplasma gondii VEG]
MQTPRLCEFDVSLGWRHLRALCRQKEIEETCFSFRVGTKENALSRKSKTRPGPRLRFPASGHPSAEKSIDIAGSRVAPFLSRCFSFSSGTKLFSAEKGVPVPPERIESEGQSMRRSRVRTVRPRYETGRQGDRETGSRECVQFTPGRPVALESRVLALLAEFSLFSQSSRSSRRVLALLAEFSLFSQSSRSSRRVLALLAEFSLFSQSSRSSRRVLALLAEFSLFSQSSRSSRRVLALLAEFSLFSQSSRSSRRVLALLAEFSLFSQSSRSSRRVLALLAEFSLFSQSSRSSRRVLALLAEFSLFSQSSRSSRRVLALLAEFSLFSQSSRSSRRVLALLAEFSLFSQSSRSSRRVLALLAEFSLFSQSSRSSRRVLALLAEFSLFSQSSRSSRRVLALLAEFSLFSQSSRSSRRVLALLAEFSLFSQSSRSSLRVLALLSEFCEVPVSLFCLCPRARELEVSDRVLFVATNPRNCSDMSPQRRPPWYSSLFRLASFFSSTRSADFPGLPSKPECSSRLFCGTLDLHQTSLCLRATRRGSGVSLPRLFIFSLSHS